MHESELDRRAFVMGSIGFGMAVLAGGSFTGCAAGGKGATEGGAAGEPAPAAAPESAPAPEPPSAAADGDGAAAERSAGKALVAVFSYSGNTLQVAERIAEATGADLFRIETTDAWPEDYDAMTAQVQRERNEGYLPPIAASVPDWDACDTVYLGHPIWWGQLPHVMRSFLQQHDLAGKTVAPFCTSGSSGNGAALDALRDLAPEADLREGLHLTRGRLPEALDEVQPWIDGLGL